MDPFLGEIRLMAFNLVPKGWLPCDGRIMQVNGNQALYALLGNNYGGTAPTTFALPDLRGRVPQVLNLRSTQKLGEAQGVEQVSLALNQIPSHSHVMYANNANGTKRNPTNNLLAIAPVPLYASPSTAPPPNTMLTLNSESVGNTGGGQGHNNMQPFLVLNFYIATLGLFPPHQ